MTRTLGEPLDWHAPARPGPITLDGHYARLEPLDPVRHGDDLARVSHDPDGDLGLWDYLGAGPFTTRDGIDRWLRQAAEGKDALFFTIVDRETDRALGWASLMRIVPADGVIEVGNILFGPELQRSRLATEAIFLLARHIFDIGYRRFEWKCNALNAPSRRAAERFGFQYEGLFRQHMVIKGRNRDTAWYAMTNGDWPAVRAAFEAWLDPRNFAADGCQIRPLAAFHPKPVSAAKKPSSKASAPPKTSIVPAASDQQAIASFLAAMADGGSDDALGKAQDLIYDAWERTTSRSRIALARKALAISPLCADAFSLLGSEAKTPEAAKDFYLRGLEAGRLALGPAGFKEFDGHFWGFLETRPYMRARQGLALTLQQLGEDDAAIGHFRGMLTLNPNDNQGIRYLLLAALLRRGDAPEAIALLASYAEEESAHWLYTRALLAFRNGAGATPATLKLVKDARSSNPHVPAILAGVKPRVLPRGGYLTVGGPDEATDYVLEFGDAWTNTPGAVTWLVASTRPAAPKRPPAKSRTGKARSAPASKR